MEGRKYETVMSHHVSPPKIEWDFIYVNIILWRKSQDKNISPVCWVGFGPFFVRGTRWCAYHYKGGFPVYDFHFGRLVRNL